MTAGVKARTTMTAGYTPLIAADGFSNAIDKKEKDLAAMLSP
jgi:hypothetical protein